MHSLAGFGALAFLGCSPASAPPRPNDPPPATCHDACERLRALDCAEAEPTEEGASCEEVCLASIVGLYSLECVTEIRACEQLDVCQLDP